RVISFGKRPWNKQQKVRTEVFDVVKDDLKDIRIYKLCMQVFIPVLRKADSENPYWDYPQVPELVARNVLAGRAWWKGFADFISDPKIGDHVMGTSKNALYLGERIGLTKMLGSSDASLGNAERMFVEACHEAWRRKLGMLGERSRDENINFDDLVKKEFIRTRISFSKCKNAQTFRETITTFWAQAEGPISSLQSGWKDVIILVVRDWKAARDLALLSLASYRKHDDSEANSQEN
ncbi:MAG: CRISPR-associated protein Cas8a1/Csx13, partial [Nitrososphaera sp.]|nr:CRISPR-associated protein Cas8a1/Csx13 [Nitrososphaera sp.]